MLAGPENNYLYNSSLKGLARKLRKNSTKSEILLWSKVLKSRKMLGYTFLRQRPVMDYIADFFCKEPLLIIELDGLSHDWEDVFEKDRRKTIQLQEAGFTVLRFRDEVVLKELQNVQACIEGWLLEWEERNGIIRHGR